MLQKRATGGLVFQSEKLQIHVDPGPGAIVRAKQYGINPTKTNILILSHAHTDHVNDALVMMEAMTSGTREKKGIVLANKTCVEGCGKFAPLFSDYYKDMVRELGVFTHGDVYKSGNAIIQAFRTKHDDPESMGFVIEVDEIRIGYVSDSEYFEGLAESIKGCEVIIVNMLRPGGERYQGHMCTEDVIKLVKKSNPKLVLLSHLGFKILEVGPEAEAKNIQKATGVRTVAAKDGMRLNLNEEIKQTHLSSFA